MKVLADECCPRAVVDAMRRVGLDVRYAAETDARADRLASVLLSPGLTFIGKLTIVEQRRVRQRVLP